MNDCLNQLERAWLGELRLAQPYVDEAIRQLERILDSPKFARVHAKTRDFLAFIVSKTLIGQADQIKELTVAIRVFGESADFDPLVSSKVRVAALALRRRIASYYATEGARDPIEILMFMGTYVPRIRRRESSGPLDLRVKRSRPWPPGH
jgi:uncharacterized membrane-anchored protein